MWLLHLACLVVCMAPVVAAAQTPPELPEVIGEEYTPTIWVDPDGCEHWVFDDGFEGYMTPHRRRDGSPVCRRQEVCGVVMSDVFFDTGSARIDPRKRDNLGRFFNEVNVVAVLIHGHTDARASDEFNMGLSQRRADAVAQIAQGIGVPVLESIGFGERRPAQTGTSSAAYQANRRVEIICLK